MQARLQLVVKGRVQGVGYRASAQARARSRGLSGWVRNCPDGSVQVTAEGSQEALLAFLEWCRQGPSLARVTELTHSFSEALGRFDGFDVRA
ncbi:MAG: acylphosphatase [Verrucomicrobia bacterium]|nr:acylphosphatase [Verrucomicrobiota bacterium]